MEKLLAELHTLWWTTDYRYRGENPACDRVLDAIQARLELMDTRAIDGQLSRMTVLQLEEILPVLDNMVDDFPLMEKYIALVMST